MKFLASIMLMLSVTVAMAGENTDRITELKTEIAQREQAISQMKKDNQPTGRFEMAVLRLRKELERRELTEEMLTTKEQ